MSAWRNLRLTRRGPYRGQAGVGLDLTKTIAGDAYHNSYEGAPNDGSAWTNGGEPGVRIVRGGAWYFDPGDLRAAYRIRYTSDRSLSNGFRLGRTLTP
jgi:formylglycine-generating enzyme required for sulfatase activity